MAASFAAGRQTVLKSDQNLIRIVAELQRKLNAQLTQAASANVRRETWDGDI